MIPIVGPKTYSDEWYATRKYRPGDLRPVVFGASEGAACLNIGYETPLHLYMRKRGELQPKEATIQMRLGSALEKVVIDEYALVTSRRVARYSTMFFHPTHSFMGASPDGRSPPHESRNKRLVEAKTTNWRMFSRKESEDKFGELEDSVPQLILIQCQQQMEVMSVAVTDVPVLIDSSWLRIYEIPRHDGIIESLVLAESELAQRIIDGRPPEPTWRHPDTARLIGHLYEAMDDACIALDEDVSRIAREALEHAAQIKELEDVKRECTNRVLAAMAGSKRATGDGVKVTRVELEEQIWKEEDLTEITKKLGQVKRRAAIYPRITES